MTELSNGRFGGTKRKTKRAIRLRQYRGSPEDRMPKKQTYTFDKIVSKIPG